MLNVRRHIQELSELRLDEIQALIYHVQPNKSRFYVIPQSFDGNTTFFVSGPGSSSLSYRDLTFNTYIAQIEASYNEVWMPDKTEKGYYYLHQANFHLYLYQSIDDDDPEKFVFLHSEPNEFFTTKNYRYKQSPHLHIKSAAGDIIPKAHIALNLTDLDNTLESCKNLTSSFEKAIILLKEEFMEPYLSIPFL